MLYEMITGRRAFEGATAATLIGAILHTDPPAPSSLQPLGQPALDRVVARCLAKDPDNRWQSARDLMLELKWIADHAAPAPVGIQTRDRRLRVLTIAVGALAVGAAAFTVAFGRRAPPDESIVRLPFSPPDAMTLVTIGAGGRVTISPDGHHLAFAATGTDGKQLVWVRALDSFDARPLPETEGGAFPFWSADSRGLGFFAQGKLKKIQIAGGPPQTLCDALQPRGATWNGEDVIVFSAGAGYELYRVSAGGGVATALAADGLNQERIQPSFLPDGRHFVYLGRPQQIGIFVGSIDSPQATLLLKDYVGVAYVPGYLLALKGTSSASAAMTLLAQPFDSERFALTGAPEAVADRIYYDSLLGLGDFSVSQTGALVYGTDKRRATHLIWFDRNGKSLGELGSSGAFSQPALSPDEHTVAVQRLDPETQDSDVWLIDTTDGIETRVTTYGNINFHPIWSPDGSGIAFASARLGPPNLHLPMTGVEKDRKPAPLLQTPFNEHFGRVSPDGRWLAYVSDESGTNEVYVQTFPTPEAKRRVSTRGGKEPKWNGDGTELFYLSADDTIMAVSVPPGATFQPGPPTALFKTRLARSLRYELTYTVSRDGRRFLINTLTDESASVPTKIVFNWPATLSHR